MSFTEILVDASLILWILISGGLIVSFLILTPRLIRALNRFDEMADVMLTRSLPLLERSDRLVDQLADLTTALADDVEVVDRTVIRVTDSVERMVELAEERVSELNALLEVAQEEAEETFFSTAALLRTLRGGSRRRGLLGRRRRRSG